MESCTRQTRPSAMQHLQCPPQYVLVSQNCWCFGERWFKVMIQSIYNLPCHSAPPHREYREVEGRKDLGCIPFNLIDIQAPLRSPTDKFAGCSNYFSNLDFMMMFYCGDKSQTFHLQTRNFKSPIKHSTPFVINCFYFFVFICYFTERGYLKNKMNRKFKIGWGWGGGLIF